MALEDTNLSQVFSKLHLSNGESITRGDTWFVADDKGERQAVGIVGLMFFVPGKVENPELPPEENLQEVEAKEGDDDPPIEDDLVELRFPAHFVVWLHGARTSMSFRRVVPMSSVLYAEQEVPTDWAISIMRQQLASPKTAAEKSQVVE